MLLTLLFKLEISKVYNAAPKNWQPWKPISNFRSLINYVSWIWSVYFEFILTIFLDKSMNFILGRRLFEEKLSSKHVLERNSRLPCDTW
jgi:hypothetical protein